MTLSPPHRVKIQTEVAGNFLKGCSAIKLARDGLSGDAADRGHPVAGPVHSLVELFSRRSQHDLPVGDRDQAELRIEMTTVLQVDQQPPP